MPLIILAFLQTLASSVMQILRKCEGGGGGVKLRADLRYSIMMILIITRLKMVVRNEHNDERGFGDILLGKEGSILDGNMSRGHESMSKI